MSLLSASLRDLADTRSMDVSIVDANGDQVTSFSSVPVPPSTGTITSVPSAATDTVILAANPLRKKYLIYNDSTKILSVALGSPASATNFTFKIAAQGIYESEVGDFTGAVHGIWQAVNGNARVTELT